ncbi:MAG: hypothetical protein ABI140_04010, partial [Jatrophihabitantaceae bacterium]
AHAGLQSTVNDAYSGLQALYRQMDGLKTHDRVAADNAVVGKIHKASSAGMHNESFWHKFFHALSTIAKWVGVALLVVAVVAVIVALPGVGELGLLGALAAATTTGGAVVSIGGATISLASVAIYGGAIASGAALIGDLGQHATGEGPSWTKVGFDVLGMVPGLGKASELLGGLGGPVGNLANVLHDGALTAKLATAYKLEGLFSKAECTEFGLNHAGAFDKIESTLGKVNGGLLGYGENNPLTGKFGIAKYGLTKANTIWGGAGAIFPGLSKAALAEITKATAQSAAQDLSPTQAQQQILQYQQAHPAAAAKAHQLANNLMKGGQATVSYPSQHHYPQSVPVH